MKYVQPILVIQRNQLWAIHNYHCLDIGQMVYFRIKVKWMLMPLRLAKELEELDLKT